MDCVFELEFASLQSLNPHIVVVTTGHEMVDRDVEIAVLGHESVKPAKLLLSIAFKIQIASYRYAYQKVS
jgi:hypothetical protein